MQNFSLLGASCSTFNFIKVGKCRRIIHGNRVKEVFLRPFFPYPFLDDLMDEGSHDKRVLDLFTKHSHHQGVTVLYLCQDMFPVGRYAKSISRNAHYIVAFKNPRDQLGVRNVMLQSFPTTWKDTLETFHQATTRPYGYLMLDLHPASSDQQRVLSHLLKDEGWTRTYQKRV